MVNRWAGLWPILKLSIESKIIKACPEDNPKREIQTHLAQKTVNKSAHS